MLNFMSKGLLSYFGFGKAKPIPNKEEGTNALQKVVNFHFGSKNPKISLDISNIAVYSNDLELSERLLKRLRELGYLQNHPELTANQFTYTYVYLPAVDHIGSHLQVEMWYPEYDENKMYADEFLKQY